MAFFPSAGVVRERPAGAVLGPLNRLCYFKNLARILLPGATGTLRWFTKGLRGAVDASLGLRDQGEIDIVRAERYSFW